MNDNNRSGIDLTITLFIFWLLLTFDFSAINVVIGIGISIGVSISTQEIFYHDVRGGFRIPNLLDLIRFLMHMIYEIYLASFLHVMRIIKKDHSPSLIVLELDVKDPLIVTLIANAITMTPGTITIDAEDNKLTILTIRDNPKDIKKIERTVKEKMEPIFLDKEK